MSLVVLAIRLALFFIVTHTHILSHALSHTHTHIHTHALSLSLSHTHTHTITQEVGSGTRVPVLLQKYLDKLFTLSSVRNYRSPTRHWRLTFRVGDHRLATWSPKKEKKNLRRCDSFAKEGGRIEKLAGVLFLPFFRFASIEYETRIAKLPHACEVQPVESCVAGAFHACCRKIENKKTKWHHVMIHNLN